MERDESGTLTRLKLCRDVFAEKIAAHHGRVVSTSGDALLAEFGSVVNAVDCAVRVQRDLFERNASLPEAQQMAFRVGINLGDVMVEGGDIFGEGVNIAARLQGLAEPGGILISGPVFEQVKNKLALGFDYLGPQPVKNIADSVQAYRVLLNERDAEVGAARPAPQMPLRHPHAASAATLPGKPPRRRRSRQERLKRRAGMVGTLILFLFAINMFTYDGDLWFQFPAAGILLVFALRTFWIGWKDEA